MPIQPIKWEPWRTEHSFGHLPTLVRDGVIRATGRSVTIYLSRGDESRFCKTWHVAVWIGSKCVYQSGAEIAADKQTAKSNLMHRANRWAEAPDRPEHEGGGSPGPFGAPMAGARGRS